VAWNVAQGAERHRSPKADQTSSSRGKIHKDERKLRQAFHPLRHLIRVADLKIKDIDAKWAELNPGGVRSLDKDQSKLFLEALCEMFKVAPEHRTEFFHHIYRGLDVNKNHRLEREEVDVFFRRFLDPNQALVGLINDELGWLGYQDGEGSRSFTSFAHFCRVIGFPRWRASESSITIHGKVYYKKEKDAPDDESKEMDGEVPRWSDLISREAHTVSSWHADVVTQTVAPSSVELHVVLIALHVCAWSSFGHSKRLIVMCSARPCSCGCD
jgi:hypothetical protein